jgi:hypothetical protein
MLWEVLLALAALVAMVTIGMPLYRLVTFPILMALLKRLVPKKMVDEFAEPFTVLGATHDARDGGATVYLSEELFRKRRTISTAAFARLYGDRDSVSDRTSRVV